MIRYKSAGVSATLITADLTASLSRSVTLTMGKEQGLDDKRVDEILAAGTVLSSRPIGADGTEKGVLQFIGEDQDIPWLMTEAGVLEPGSTHVSLEPPQQQALRLAVNTTDQAHLGRRKTTEMDIKIEVYLNGELCDSFFTKKSGLINQYTLNGTRIHRQIEKPWTYQPSSGLQPGSLTAEQRWSRISASLAAEVRLRGTNQRGDLSPVGKFFQALAQVPLPSRLQEKAHLSIIDVIVVSGKGAKDGPSNGYIARPTRLRSVEYESSEPLSISAQLDPPVRGQLFDVATQRNIADDNDTPSLRRDSVAAALPLRLPSDPAVNGRGILPSRFETTMFASTVAQVDDPFADGPVVGALPSSSAYTPPGLRSSSSDIPPATAQRSTPQSKLGSAIGGLPSESAYAPPVLRSSSSDILPTTVQPLKLKLGSAIGGLPSSSTYAPPVLRSSSSDIPLATVQRSTPKTPKLKLKFRTIQPERKLTPGEQNAKDFAALHGIPYDPDAKIDSFKARRGREGGSRMVTQRITDIKKMTPSHQREAIQQLKHELGQILPTSRPGQPTPAKPSRLVKLPLPSGAFTPKPSPAAATMAAPQPTGTSRRQRGLSNVQHHNSPNVAKNTPRAQPADGMLGGSVQTPVQNTPIITTTSRRSSRKPGKLDDQIPEEALANFRLPEMCQGSVVSYAGGDASRQIPKTRPGYFEEDEFIVGMRFVVV